MKAWLQRPVHISWFVAWLSAGLLLGIGLCLVVETDIFVSPSWLVVSALLIMAVVARRVRWALMVICCAGLLIGLWRGSVYQQKIDAYVPLFGTVAEVSGRVSQDTSYSPKGDQRLRIDKVKIDNRHYAGELWVSTDERLDIKRGDSVVVVGTIKEGFGSLAAAMHRAEVIGIERPVPGDVGRVVRDWFADKVRSVIAEPQVSLGLGYLLGQKSALPEQLEKQIQMIALTHVVVASGYNLTILVAITRRAFARFSKYLATLLGGSMILSFMLITGLSPSMTRAGLVAGLSLAAWYFGRQMHPFVLLPMAAALTALVRPTYVWGDIGWYLSFTAFIGVLVLAPLIQDYFWGPRSPGFFRELIVSTFAAQVLTLPIILTVYGSYSIYSLLANLLVLPAVPVSMFATFIAGLGGIIGGLVGSIVAFPASLLLSYATTIIDTIASLPNAQSELDFGVVHLVVSYCFMVGLMVHLKRATQHDFRSQKSIID